MTAKNVADSTDWLATPLAGFAAVEASLRCRVCKDFYTTPMITSCFHTFCSLCIRRALSSDGKCPLCRTSEQELRLRSNWALGETVEAFRKVRQDAITVAHEASDRPPAGKRRMQDDTVGNGTPPQPKRLRHSARLDKGDSLSSDPEGFPKGTQDAVMQDSEDDKGDSNTFETDDGLVACPICQRRMKEWQVFKHVESCTGSMQTTNIGESSRQSTGISQSSQASKLDRLPALNYSMLKEKGLRQKLAELGLPTSGSRSALESRHKEWITLWNANCDAVRPKKRAELLQDLSTWEQTQRGMTQGRGQSLVAVKDKDFDSVAWKETHKESYKELIALAHKSRDDAMRKSRHGEERDRGNSSNEPLNGQIEQVTIRPDAETSQNNDLKSVLPLQQKDGREGH